LIFYLLAREVLYLRRGSFNRSQEWDVMVDSFFWRDPDEVLEKEEESAWEKPAETKDNWNQDWEAPAEGGESWSAPQANAEGW